jgi:hypothetical protein
MPWDCVKWHKTFWQKQWRNSDETLMQQWWNSDAFDLSSFMSFSSFRDVIDHIISFNNALEVWLLIWWWNIPFDKTSDQTVMRQWCNSDQTLIPLIRALFCHFQAFEMSLIIIHPLKMHLKCDYASAGDTRLFDKICDQTVMRQWCNSDATVMHSIWALL